MCAVIAMQARLLHTEWNRFATEDYYDHTPEAKDRGEGRGLGWGGGWGRLFSPLGFEYTTNLRTRVSISGLG